MRILDLDKIKSVELVPGCNARIIHGDRMTVVYWDIKAGAEVPEHGHPHEQVVNLLSGKLELTVDGKRHTLGAGSIVVIPPDATHSGRAASDCRVLDVFTPVREDLM